MSLKIFLAQSPEEIRSLKECQDFWVVPLDLASQLFCIKKDLKYINLSSLLSNKTHESIIFDLAKYNVYFRSLSAISYAGEDLAAFMQFTLSQIFYVQEIVNALDEYYGFVEIYVSGWSIQSEKLYSDVNYIVSDIAKFLFKNRVKELNKYISTRFEFVKVFCGASMPAVDLLINSRGYNMHRIANIARQNGLKVGMLHGNYGFKPLIKSYLMGIHVAKCKFRVIEDPSHSWLENINLPDGEIGSFLSELLERKKNNFLNIAYNCIAIEDIFVKADPASVYSFSMRGSDGHLLKFAFDNDVRSVCIPHGTVAKGFNNVDIVYKQSIANSVFSGECSYLAIQSKIANDALDNIQHIGKPIVTGNLIFAEVVRNEPRHLLYAVTLKGFYGMQFCGVEMYYEFLENLRSLVRVSATLQLPILVNLHPSSHSLIQDLQELFPELNFSIEGVAAGLKNAIATISYSSTSIEDSLYSHVPVILFDQWGRYQHCAAVNVNASKLFGAIYYVKSEDQLIDAINIINQPDFSADFEEYIYKGQASNNFRNLII